MSVFLGSGAHDPALFVEQVPCVGAPRASSALQPAPLYWLEVLAYSAYCCWFSAPSALHPGSIGCGGGGSGAGGGGGDGAGGGGGCGAGGGAHGVEYPSMRTASMYLGTEAKRRGIGDARR